MTISADTIARLMSEPGKPIIVWSEEQREAIEIGMQPHLIVAGAGSGKTTVMTARILWLIGRGQVRPDHVLGLTFTNKAAGEFAERITAAMARMRREGLVPLAYDEVDEDVGAQSHQERDGDGNPLISTYHAFAQRLLVDHGLRIGYEPGATLLNEVSRQQLAYRTVLRTKLGLTYVSRHVPTVVGQLLELDAVLAERLIEPHELLDDETERITWLQALPTLQDAGNKMLKTSWTRVEVAQLVMEFREAKRRNFVTDFADQMRTAAGLAADLAAGAPDVIAELRTQAAAVLLDEYQDTSVAQRRMIQSLFGQGHPIMAVGDPCQAIYGWRGASVFNIDEFTDDFPKADASAASYSTLTEVRRCAPEILSVANTLSQELRVQHPKVKELRPPAQIAYRGRFEVARLESVADETAWVVAQIEGALGVYAPAEVAVLCRKRSDIAVTAAALDSAGIAYDVVGVTALLNRPEIADLVAVLRVLHNPADNPALIRLLAGHRWGLGVRDLAALGAHARRHSVRQDLDSDADVGQKLRDAVNDQDPADVFALCDVLEEVATGKQVDGLSADAAARCAEFVGELHYLRRFIGEPMDEVIARILSVTGLAVEARIGAPELVTTRVHALDVFSQLAEDYVGLDRDLSLAGFLQWLEDAERFEKAPSLDVPSSGINLKLMTVHASKGLEFDAVVLPYLVDGVFPASRGRPRWPSSAKALPSTLMEEREQPHMYPQYPDLTAGPRSKDKKEFDIAMSALDLMEERRLAYVAVTRARKLVVASGHVWGATQKNPREPSPWLTAMRDYVEAGGAGCVAQWVEVAAGAIRPEVVQREYFWPSTRAEFELLALREAASLVDQVQARQQTSSPAASADQHTHVDTADDEVLAWAADVDALLAEWAAAQNPVREVRMPTSLSTTAVIRLAENPAAFASRLARPMPAVSSMAASRGTALHAYIENKWRGELALFDAVDVDDLLAASMTDAETQTLIAGYEAGPFAERAPYAVEVPFTLVLDGHTVNGRIDAIFREPDGRWLVIDWKSSREESANGVQLAVYRHAWAERHSLSLDEVDAAFHYVRTGNSVTPPEALLTRDELRRILNPD